MTEERKVEVGSSMPAPTHSLEADSERADLRRVLVVDDNRAIHEDYRKILEVDAKRFSGIEALEVQLFGQGEEVTTPQFRIASSYQGQEALEMVREALKTHRPFRIAFVDMRMPPGWDGLETIGLLLKEDPRLQVVLCTAYSDYSWEDIIKKVGETDRLFILKKPFETIEVRQLAHVLNRRWWLKEQAEYQFNKMTGIIRSNAEALEQANAQLRKEMADRERVETELRLAQKLEAVGQLAAGIAHEINTPMQYVGDNIHFLRGAFDDFLGLIRSYQALRNPIAALPEHEGLCRMIKEAEEKADLAYLEDCVPKAFERTSEGVGRVTAIVRAMKEFSHPDQREKVPCDLNQSLLNTLTVARNEYKYVAEVETELGDLPPVVCLVGDVNQVFLNLIVNAAHAISDVIVEGQGLGKITIRTELEDAETVLISIRDTGAGIPESIRQRVFDPFFTTKPIGKGTGQGLAIARSVVVDKHGGSLLVESEVGRGTVFFIRLPVDGKNKKIGSTI